MILKITNDSRRKCVSFCPPFFKGTWCNEISFLHLFYNLATSFLPFREQNDTDKSFVLPTF